MVQYIADEMGFILYDKQDRANEAYSPPSIASFGPYYVEQYMLMEVLDMQLQYHLNPNPHNPPRVLPC